MCAMCVAPPPTVDFTSDAEVAHNHHHSTCLIELQHALLFAFAVEVTLIASHVKRRHANAVPATSHSPASVVSGRVVSGSRSPRPQAGYNQHQSPNHSETRHVIRTRIGVT